MTKTPKNVILNEVNNPAHSLGESSLKGDICCTPQSKAITVGILTHPKARSE
jgi:hypothetical protein